MLQECNHFVSYKKKKLQLFSYHLPICWEQSSRESIFFYFWRFSGLEVFQFEKWQLQFSFNNFSHTWFTHIHFRSHSPHGFFGLRVTRTGFGGIYELLIPRREWRNVKNFKSIYSTLHWRFGSFNYFENLRVFPARADEWVFEATRTCFRSWIKLWGNL